MKNIIEIITEIIMALTSISSLVIGILIIKKSRSRELAKRTIIFSTMFSGMILKETLVLLENSNGQSYRRIESVPHKRREDHKSIYESPYNSSLEVCLQ